MIKTETIANGLVVLIEEMPQVESVAYELQIPGGIVTDESDHIGSSLILAELTARGAGELESRALSEALDGLGINHSESSGTDRFYYRGSLLTENLDPALHLLSSMVQKPILPEDEIESIRSILLQDLASLSDNPARRVVVELTEFYYPDPWGRSTLGTEEGLKACDIKYLRMDWERRFRPEGSVLSIAGNIKADQVLKMIEKHFGAWRGKALTKPPFKGFPPHRSHHITFESAQLQVALTYPSAKFGDPHFYTAKVATGVLSGGMCGRLFIEVREKRGLCYSVFARHSGTAMYGSVLVYAGTTPERAQETIDVAAKELWGLRGSISAEERARSVANLKAALIIGEESSSSRASSNAGDWWQGRRVRSIEEIAAAIEKVTIADMDDYLEKFPSDSFTLVTLGGKELKVPSRTK